LESKKIKEKELEEFRDNINGLLGEFAILEQKMLGELNANPEETIKKAVTSPTFTKKSITESGQVFTGEEPTLEHISPTDNTIAGDPLAVTGEIDGTGKTMAFDGTEKTLQSIDPIADTAEFDGTETTIPSMQPVEKDTIDTSAPTIARKPITPEDLDKAA
tara:strand:+ start:53 stop:535 length:483 start_codon:yes stop_codon:yes gene_type:complete